MPTTKELSKQLRGHSAVAKWVAVSVIIFFPVLLGYQLDPEFVKKTELSGPRDLLETATSLSMAASVPLLVDLYLDSQAVVQTWFWQRFAMLMSAVFCNLVILLSNWWDISELKFISIALPLTILRDNVMRGALVSYLHREDSPKSIIQAADAYFIVCLFIVMCRIYSWFFSACALAWHDVLNGAAFTAQFGLIVECFRMLFCGEKRVDFRSDLGLSICFAIFGLFATSCSVLILSLFSTHIMVSSSLINTFVVVVAFYISKIWTRQDHVLVKDLLNAKREFVRYIAHEMRTPLNVGVIGLELARSHCADNTSTISRLKQILSETHTAIEEVADILNEFLLFDKVESGTLSLEKEEFLILPVLQSVYKSFFLQAQDKSLQYSLSADSSLQSVALRADRKKITQAMRNYISNALKFTPADGSVTISARACPADGTQEGVYTFHFEVVDTGAGIAASNLPRVFKEVVQFEAARLQNGGGSGLGLTITRAIVEAHGGAVGVRSVYGRGSTFWLDLEAHTAPSTVAPMVRTLSSDLTMGPQYEGCSSDLSTPACTPVEHPAGMSKPPLDLASPPMLSAASTPPPTSLSTFEKLGVALIVDDSKINLKMMSRICAPFVQEIVTATNGVEGAEIVEASLRGQDRRRIDVVLTDYHMPVMDGIEMTARIRAAGYSGFIALVTGDDGVVMSNFHASGGNMILSKPVTVTAITRTFVEAHRTLQI